MSSSTQRHNPNRSRRNHISRRILLPALAGLLVVLVAVLVSRKQASPAQAHIDLGLDYAARGASEDAGREFRLATSADPKCSMAWQLLAKWEYEAGHWAQAREALEQVARLSPNTPRVHSLLASCARNQGELKLAVSYAREELKRSPDDVPALEVLTAAAIHDGASGEMIQALRRLTVLQPDKLDNWVALASVQNNALEAIPVLDHILQVSPDNANMLLLRGSARYTADGTVEGLRRAEDDLKRAEALQLQLYGAPLFLSRVYRKRGQWDLALAQLQRAIALDPQRQDAYFDLAAVYDRAGKPALAAAARMRFRALSRASEQYDHLKLMCAASPDDFELNLTVGQLAIQHHDLKTARVFLDRARKIRPTDPRLLKALQAGAAQAKRNPQ